MTTIITPQSNNSDSGVGMIVCVLLGIIVIGVLFFVFILPQMQETADAPNGSTTDINVTIPAGSTDNSGNSSN